MYGGLGMSAPSLHRESTDSLIYPHNVLIFKQYMSIKLLSFLTIVKSLLSLNPITVGISVCVIVDKYDYPCSLHV